MGVRRVTCTFAQPHRGDARHVYDALSQDGSTYFDVTLRHAVDDKSIVECIALTKDVAPLLSYLGTVAGVGTTHGPTVAISDTLATVPPMEQRIAWQTRGGPDPPLVNARASSHQSLYSALTPAEVRSRMTVDEIYAQIDASSKLSFDFVMLVLAAAAIATAGLVQDSSVTVVASMLLSPLMSPILAITFGLAVGHGGLARRGLRAELAGVSLALMVGLCIGSVLAPLFGPHGFAAGELDPHRSLDGETWAVLGGSNVSWPFVLESTQIRSRGSANSLLAGTLIALPSGFAVVLAMTGGSQNALVGVAIAAALLPPVVNAGLCWALAFWWQIFDPQANWVRARCGAHGPTMAVLLL